MSTIPSFPLYAPDWIQDTAFMSLEAKGMFIELLCYCWLHEGLPSDLDELSILTRTDKRKFKRIWKEIEHKFVETSPELLANLGVEVGETSPELLRNFSKKSLKLWNPRMLKDMLYLADKQRKLRISGSKGGLAKARNLLQKRYKQKASIPEPDIRKEKVEKESYPQTDDTEQQKTNGTVAPTSRTSPNLKKKTKQEIDWKAIDGLNVDAWMTWMDFRRQAKKHKYETDRSAKALAKYPPDVQQDAIILSMENEWSGLFPEKIINNRNNQQRANTIHHQSELRRPTPPTVSELKKQQTAAQRREDLTRAQRETIAEKRALDDESAAVQRRETAKAHLGKLRSKETFSDSVSEDGEATRLGVILKKVEQRSKE